MEEHAGRQHDRLRLERVGRAGAAGQREVDVELDEALGRGRDAEVGAVAGSCSCAREGNAMAAAHAITAAANDVFMNAPSRGGGGRLFRRSSYRLVAICKFYFPDSASIRSTGSSARTRIASGTVISGA